jgi:hypothetical protein
VGNFFHIGLFEKIRITIWNEKIYSGYLILDNGDNDWEREFGSRGSGLRKIWYGGKMK